MSLNIVCLLKVTLPTEAKIALNAAGRASDDKAKPIINPYDEFAIEEAVKLREAGRAASVTVLSVGPQSGRETILRAIAMGCDKAVLVDTGTAGPDAIDGAVTARALAGALKSIPHNLILCGKVAVDTGAAEVPGRLAELLGIDLISVVSKLEVTATGVVANREADGRTEIVEAPFPCIVTADKSLNKPRYPNLPSIMKAKSKPFDVVPLATALGGDAPALRRVVANTLPPARGPVKIMKGAGADAVSALVSSLRDEAKAIR